MLAIALVPSIALLVSGVALTSYLVYQAVAARTFIGKVHDAAVPGAQFFAAVRVERQLTLTDLSTRGTVHSQLLQARTKTDATAAQMSKVLGDMYDLAPDRVKAAIEKTAANVAQLQGFRGKVDSGQAAVMDAFAFYNQIIDEYTEALNGVAERAPDAEAAYLRVSAMPLFVGADAMARGDALAAAGLAGGGLTDDEFRAYVGVVGAYHAGFESQSREMIPAVKSAYDALLASPAWATLTKVENSILGGNHVTLPVPQQQWRDAANQVAGTLMNLYIQQSSNATQSEIDTGNQMLVTAIVAGVATLLISFAVSLFAWRLSTRLVQRLRRLRRETLDIAEVQLPDLVERVRNGEEVDLSTEVAVLEHGRDEIGQVAEAFNKAQQTAVAAAVDEAKTREGTNKVFLNIAHRSQVLVHRQLKTLDEAERKQEDPDQLDLLFRLDHLSTRARRNAENLIILGGERPGRQWRNPVALTDLIRGATAETEDYARVNVGRMPAVAVNGPVVADLIHLLAELIDNATSFSPPNSRVEIWADQVGRGVVIEIEDQGLGIEPDQSDELNAMLQKPPDFGMMALSAEPRLGLFVVARLASRHGLTVTLRRSAYGGTRAIVLVRSELLTAVPQPEDEADEAVAATTATTTVAAMAAVPAQQPLSGDHPSLPQRRTQADAPRTEAPRRGTLSGTAPDGPAPAEPASRNDMFQPAARHGHTPQARPQHSRPPQHETRAGENRAPQPGGPMSPDRPPLPHRRRQQNLAPQLLANEASTEAAEVPVEDPNQARSRLSAFQSGTRRAREQDLDATDFLGERR
ncbi:nitrate- and nitrite sensing domain-containing protein [Amycolatopsis cynarae]|uniref:histidine kinase n=1 Tax=Amycolatopsis cynarae TaxID=2995223 RepID=A0ABY7ATJ7_9PSEU|nr:nitrate- and nitrite sensing domain-containing protein [Amycolatopsis sp. HUAS 11-8]WAL63295.1 nitrate- and nitrite sensing domain-containing protein [Amycolatopsis sp. HUAS 11-8]